MYQVLRNILTHIKDKDKILKTIENYLITYKRTLIFFSRNFAGHKKEVFKVLKEKQTNKKPLHTKNTLPSKVVL